MHLLPFEKRTLPQTTLLDRQTILLSMKPRCRKENYGHTRMETRKTRGPSGSKMAAVLSTWFESVRWLRPERSKHYAQESLWHRCCKTEPRMDAVVKAGAGDGGDIDRALDSGSPTVPAHVGLIRFGRRAIQFSA